MGASLDLGRGSITYENRSPLLVSTISPSVFFSRSFMTVTAAGNFSRFDDQGWGARTMVAVSLLTPSWHGLRAEFSSSAESNSNRLITAGGEVVGQARAHLADREKGIWVGGSAARVWNGFFWQNLSRSELGGWQSVGGVMIKGAVVRSSYLPGVSPDGRRRNFYDAELVVVIENGPLAVESAIGRRFAGSLEEVVTWRVGGTLWLNRFAGLVVGGGKYASNPAQALPGGTYLSFGMRITPLKIGRGGLHRNINWHSEEVFSVTEMKESEVHAFRLMGIVARRVDLAGTFTAWEPISMVQIENGVWELVLPAVEGTHFFNVRIDGKEWRVPEGVTRVDDDFNGEVGLVIVSY